MSQAVVNLQRFIEAQETVYPIALAEIKSGRKRSHWMWYIFPQIFGLGFSSTSQFYAVQDLAEAAEYLFETSGFRTTACRNRNGVARFADQMTLTRFSAVPTI